MSRRPFVVNASPLIFLARIDHLPLLWRLAEEVLVPSAVVREVLAGQDLPPALVRLEALPDLRVAPPVELPDEVAGWDLGAGESQVLALAASRPACEAVVDDLQARRCAKSLGIAVTGTLGLLLRAKKAGLIPAVRPLVEELLRSRLYLTEALVEAALAEVGEGRPRTA